MDADLFGRIAEAQKICTPPWYIVQPNGLQSAPGCDPQASCWHKALEELTEDDFVFVAQQKGVDHACWC